MDDQQKLLNIIHKATPLKILNYNTAIDRIRLTYFYYKLEGCLRSDGYKNNSTMGPLAICLNSETFGTGKDMLNHVHLGAYLKSGASRTSNVLVLDYDGKLIKSPDKTIIANPADAAQSFNQEDTTLFFLSGERLDIFYKTILVECIPNIFTHNRSVIVSNMTLPVSEYRSLVTAHYEERINKKNYLRYWKDKKKRLLVAAPEDLFGKDLGYYLNKFIADGHVDTECYNAWTDDRTDIRIVRDKDRHIYIIEIKWLGKSISDKGGITRHTDLRANSGIVQLNEYLKKETLSICGVLVVYDARDNDLEIQYDPSINRDARIEAPMRFYLISESASKKGDRIAKQSKGKRPYKGSKL